MNLVGKIITILILLLSVCFMMIGIMANASHQNWKEQAIANKAKVEELLANRKLILNRATEQDTIIEKEKVARSFRIQELESQLQLARDDYAQAIEQLAAQRVKAEESFTIVKESENRIAEQDKLITDLQGQLELLTVDVATQRGKVHEMTTQIFDLKSTNTRLETIRDDLVQENTEQHAVLNRNGLNRFSNTSHIPQELSGVITAIDNNTIVVSLGTDDGLNKGHTVDIYRNGQFIGAATVFDARENKSAARIDRALTKVSVQKNDQVATKWVLQDMRGR